MQRHSRLTIVAALLAMLPGCAPVNINAPSLTIPDGAVDIAWSDQGAAHVAHQYSSGFTEPARLLIDNQSAWNAAWAQLNAGASQRPLPAIDFSRYSVFIAAFGTRNTGGYDINVSRLANASHYLYVEITSTSPGATCGTTQALTQPVDIIRVAKPHAPLAYVERTLVHEC